MGIRIAGGRAMLGPLAALALVAGPVRAETLGEVLAARGVAPIPRSADTDRPLRTYQVLDDERDLLVVYLATPPAAPILQAARFERTTRRWTTAPLDWAGAADAGAHINPSAECTVVLGPDLAVRGVLAGWPVATLADGRLVYQRNQVHFASFHPVALALWDGGRAAETALYPPRPAGGLRRAHVDRLRGVYTTDWCRAHNHPCDPELFDERVSGRVATGAGDDALAFVVAWDNTAGWSDAERWGRLEPFRELRAALPAWNGAAGPPDLLFRTLAAGLARARNLTAQDHVAAALAGEPALRDLVGAALAAPRVPGRDERAWLMSLDPRWGDAATWRALARAVAVPDEYTEVVYVYAGLRPPGPVRYRELLRSDFEARFGPGLPDRALAPDVRRAIFRSDVN
jgi:hypothetical protein